jgi:hypothetical protein
MNHHRFPRPALAALAAAILLLGLTATAGAFGSWAVVSSPNVGAYGSLLNDIAARTASDAWAVGATAKTSSNDTLALHWNGSSWSAVTTPNPVPGCYDGNVQWTGNRLNGVAPVSATDVWAVGTSCYEQRTLVERWNGSSWRIVPSPSFQTGGDGIQNELHDVAAVSAANVWAVGFHTASNGAYVTLALRWNGSAWNVVTTPNPNQTVSIFRGVAATGPTDVWAVGYTNAGASQPLIEHWNGAAWSVVPSPKLSTGSILERVAALSPTDAWAVGYQVAPSGAQTTLAEHWNGKSWSVVPTPNLSTAYGSSNVLRGVTAVSPTDVWAVGMFQNDQTNYHQHRTLTLHWNGSTWSVVSSPTPGRAGELTAVAAPPAGKLQAVGYFSRYDINIYDGTYTDPRTLVLSG